MCVERYEYHRNAESIDSCDAEANTGRSKNTTPAYYWPNGFLLRQALAALESKDWQHNVIDTVDGGEGQQADSR